MALCALFILTAKVSTPPQSGGAIRFVFIFASG
jgi:hypothetical protein